MTAQRILSSRVGDRQTDEGSHEEEFIERFSDRIQALAASHDLLAENQWHSIAI